MCDPNFNVTLVQSVSLPVLSLGAASTASPNKNDNLSSGTKKPAIFEFPIHDHTSTHDASSTAMLSVPLSLNKIIPPLNESPICFDFHNHNTREKTYRSIAISTTQTKQDKHSPFEDLFDDEKYKEDGLNVPQPIQWFGKSELSSFNMNRRTSNSSTTSTTSATSINTCSSSATTFTFNNEIGYNEPINLAEDIEKSMTTDNPSCRQYIRADPQSKSPIYHIQMQPLIADMSQLNDAGKLDAEESYESDSESDRDDASNRAPSPTARVTITSQTHTFTNCNIAPIPISIPCSSDTHHDDIGIDGPLCIYKKQSTQKLLKDIDYTDQDEDEDGDNHTDVHLSDSDDSTLDYDSTVHSSPKLKPSPSSLDPDELPDLPEDEDRNQDHRDQDTNTNEREEIERATIQTILYRNTSTKIKKLRIDPYTINARSQRTIFKFDKNVIEKYQSQYQAQFEPIYTNHKELIEVAADIIDAEIPQISYEELCEEVLIPYDWQKQIPNEQNYGAYFPNFQKEIMKNPFFKLTAGDFNDVLKKCQFIRSRWLGEKIRSTRCGQYGKAAWKPGEKIKELDLFAIKLYTDFESCQRELKKCYRPPSMQNELEMQQYEQRLCHFSHWRRLLNTAILKYGSLLRNRVFYHGINKIMQLNVHPTSQCHGPFSATSDIEIARGFATKNGFIMKMCSKYPRLDTDYFFDAASISAYPDEKEYLIGFMYTRILHIQLGCTKLCVEDLTERHIKKLTCFIISSLVKHHLYSYGPYLELLFKALLITDSKYDNEEELQRLLFDTVDSKQRQREMRNLREIAKQIPKVIIKEFIERRQKQRVLKLDKISSGMECIFYNNYDKSHVNLQRIHKYNPNISELHLYEDYNINNDFIDDFIYFLDSYQNIQLSTIKLFKYSFDGSSKQFQCLNSISTSNQHKLQNMGWKIKEYRDPNCYKFILKRKK